MLKEFIDLFTKRFPNHNKETFHLIESNGKHIDYLFLFFITYHPTAYIYQTKKLSKNFIFIAL
jgi:hypothetical protein